MLEGGENAFASISKQRVADPDPPKKKQSETRQGKILLKMLESKLKIPRN